MRKVTVLGICLCLCLLPACREMPEEVKEQAKEYNAERELTEKDTVEEVIAAKDLAADVKQTLSEHFQNLKLPEHLSVAESLPGEIPLIELEYVSDFNQKREELWKDFLGEEIWAQEKDRMQAVDYGIEDEEQGIHIDDIGYVIEDEEKQYHLETGDNGFVCMITPAAYGRAFEASGKCLEDWYPLQEPVSETPYQLSNGAYTAGQAVETAEKWANTVWKKYEPDFDFRVNALSVYQNADGTCYFTMDLVKFYKGVLLSDVVMPDGDMDETKKAWVSTHLYIEMYRCGSIDTFSSSGGGMRVVKEQGMLTESYGLNGGLRKIEQEFAGFRNFSIRDIDVRYMMQASYDRKTEHADSPGVKVLASPSWGIWLADQRRSYRISSFGMEHLFYVDMQTGELGHNLEK